MTTQTNYKSMSNCIQSSMTTKSLKRCSKSLDNLWNNGLFTVSEFQRLDFKIFNKTQTLINGAN